MKCAVDRRRMILEILNERRFDTIGNLAVRFGVHKNTILNDLMVISCYAPIYTVQGKGGGVKMIEGYNSNNRYLSINQEKALVDVINGNPPDIETLSSILVSFAFPK